MCILFIFLPLMWNSAFSMPWARQPDDVTTIPNITTVRHDTVRHDTVRHRHSAAPCRLKPGSAACIEVGRRTGDRPLSGWGCPPPGGGVLCRFIDLQPHTHVCVWRETVRPPRATMQHTRTWTWGGGDSNMLTDVNFSSSYTCGWGCHLSQGSESTTGFHHF